MRAYDAQFITEIPATAMVASLATWKPLGYTDLPVVNGVLVKY